MSKTELKSKSLTPLEFFEEKKKYISNQYNKAADKRDFWIKKNKYYYDYLTKVLRCIVEPQSKVLQIKCETGYFLNAVNPQYGLGIDSSEKMIEIAATNFPKLNFKLSGFENFSCKEKFDYVLLINVLGDILDIQKSLQALNQIITVETRIVIINYSSLWKPLLAIAAYFNIKIKQPTQNWLSLHDVENLLHLSGYETIKNSYIILAPIGIPLISNFFNYFVAKLPFIQKLCFNHLVIAKKNAHLPKNEGYSVSVVIPCMNEKGNIENAVRRVPKMGKHTEIIFCDDKSGDGTSKEVLRVKKHYPDKDIKLYEGPGICKARNIWIGFDNAQGDILMILDADLTVIPEELPLFYSAIVEGKAEFINGSRLVYPMRENSMKFLNILGNKFFSVLFSYILNQKIKDTLCGTKVMWRKDYFRIKKFFGEFGPEDLWGDHVLIFGAAKINLKIIDLPIHYFDRVHGETKMTKVFGNGIRMLRICIAALTKLRFF